MDCVRRGDHTITWESNDVPMAESLAFSYHELIRANLLVCEIDRVSTYVPIPGFKISDHVDRQFLAEYLIIVLVTVGTVQHPENLQNITICRSAWCTINTTFFFSLNDSTHLEICSRCHRSKVLSDAHSAAGEKLGTIIGTLLLCRYGPYG